MTALATTHPTLLDITKRLDPNGAIDKIAEMLTLTNPMLDDAVWVEGNLPTGHKTTVRTGLPSPTWRKLNGGVIPGKSTTAQITAACGMMEAYAEVDKKLADLHGNAMAFRASEDAAHIEGMNQEFASTLIYGTAAVSEEFVGLAAHFNDQSANNGGNILTDAATPDNADNSSIYLVVWSPQTVHCVYPKGSKAGIDQKDLGEVTVGDATSGYYQAYRTHYAMDCGLVVRDWRYVVRIQVDVEDLVKNAASGPDLIDLMGQALDLVPSLSMGRPVFYANRTVRSFLRRQMVNKIAGSTLSMDQLTRANGQLTREIFFDGIPVRRCDAITNAETGI